jgi:hypothetical protein
MDVSRYRCTLVTPDGASLRVGPRGLVIGREHGCDIQLSDPAISRRHALLRLSFDGVELVPLGRLPVELNGKPCERATTLANGDQIKVGDLVFVANVELPRPDAALAPYRLVRGRSSYGISHTPFVVGGGPADDLILKKFPPGALHFHLAQGELFVEVLAGAATKNGAPLEAEALEPLDIGDVLGYLDDAFEVARGEDRAHTTMTGDLQALPTRVAIEMLPRGGRVVFSLPTGDHVVYLADRRLDLIAALVKPPTGFKPGDFIPDDVLRPIVWPRNPNVIRSEINVHITRCRKDLLAAGLAGPRLLQRSPTGGATRLALAPNCAIEFT